MRIIDADALAKKLTDWSTGTVEPIDWSDIAEEPTIDAVSVVRCAECRWSRPRTLKGETGYRCVFYRVDKAENGYCDCGERKESE